MGIFLIVWLVCPSHTNTLVQDQNQFALLGNSVSSFPRDTQYCHFLRPAFVICYTLCYIKSIMNCFRLPLEALCTHDKTPFLPTAWHQFPMAKHCYHPGPQAKFPMTCYIKSIINSFSLPLKVLCTHDEMPFFPSGQQQFPMAKYSHHPGPQPNFPMSRNHYRPDPVG